MVIAREILERVERVRDYHQASKLSHLVDASVARRGDASPQPSPFRIFDGYPKTPLPTNLISASVPTLSVLHQGLEVVPESQLQPGQNLRTLATWLYFSYGLTQHTAGPMKLRACPSEGNLFPCEIYVAAFAIDGLVPGLYHFSTREFALRKLRDGWETLAQIKKGRPDLEFLKTVPAVMLVSTIFCRSTWRYRKRGYRHSLTDAGHLLQNLSTAATGAGIQTLTRMRLNNQTARELIGIATDTDFGDAEAVQGMVIWADKAANPITPPPGYTPSTSPMEALPRPALAQEVVGYGSILAAHEDCVAPGVALREVRPPLTELSPLSKDFPTIELPIPSPPDGGELLGRVLLTKTPASDFARLAISRDRLWNLNRLAFRWGSSFPLFPDGQHVALVRPFWIINEITGMDVGVWYYHPQKDSWSMMGRARHRQEAKTLAMDNPAFGNASAVCFMFANINRLMNDGGPDLYRLAHLEAGNAAQRMYLAASGSGMGCCFSSLFYDDEARTFFGLEKTGWEPIYSLAIGLLPNATATDVNVAGDEESWLG